MQLKIKRLKYIPNSKFGLLLVFLSFLSLQAQEVVIDSTNVIKEEIGVKPKVNDTVKPFTRFKAEGVSAVIGEYVVLDSDIDKGYLELQQQGISIEDVTRCQLLGKLMEDKLYAHHAKVDSLIVSDDEVNQTLDQQLAYIINQFGGDEDKVAHFLVRTKPLC